MDSEFFDPPAREDEALTLNIDGWEGPLDLLLSLARVQKNKNDQITFYKKQFA